MLKLSIKALLELILVEFEASLLTGVNNIDLNIVVCTIYWSRHGTR
jgi:hypothetical protein